MARRSSAVRITNCEAAIVLVERNEVHSHCVFVGKKLEEVAVEVVAEQVARGNNAHLGWRYRLSRHSCESKV